MWDVSLVRCDCYDAAVVEPAMREMLDAIGGLNWVTAGMKVGIKANLVSFLKPETAATTHPAALCALVKMLKERGAEVVVGDSPGGIYAHAYVSRVYAATGMKLVEQAGAALNFNFGESQAEFPEASVIVLTRPIMTMKSITAIVPIAAAS